MIKPLAKNDKDYELKKQIMDLQSKVSKQEKIIAELLKQVGSLALKNAELQISNDDWEQAFSDNW